MLDALTAEPLDRAPSISSPRTWQVTTIDIGNPADQRRSRPRRTASFNIRFNDAAHAANAEGLDTPDAATASAATIELELSGSAASPS